MPRVVAFLRAINVGGHVVKMDALRAHFEALGLELLELRQIRARPTSRESSDDRPAHGV